MYIYNVQCEMYEHVCISTMCNVHSYNIMTINILSGGSVVLRLECPPSTFDIASSNLSPDTSCWKVGSYLPMPGI